ncbi:hypothetical protein VN12_06840 [Pirellula sp. SH-Sr6A]|nr:hypothetical protein VN12_06840 [Pirellula sp. SH-Sr6A]
MARVLSGQKEKNVRHCRSVVLNRSASPNASREISSSPRQRAGLSTTAYGRGGLADSKVVLGAGTVEDEPFDIVDLLSSTDPYVDPERIKACSRGSSASDTPGPPTPFSIQEGLKKCHGLIQKTTRRCSVVRLASRRDAQSMGNPPGGIAFAQPPANGSSPFRTKREERSTLSICCPQQICIA